jgi:hypothetical protein
MIDGHPIFEQFKPFHGPPAAGFRTDFIGSRQDRRFVNIHGPENLPDFSGSQPPFDENYFEWISILDAVAAVKDQFTFIELGAGYGRWTARAFKAAEQKGLSRFSAVLVEAEPVHAA